MKKKNDKAKEQIREYREANPDFRCPMHDAPHKPRKRARARPLGDGAADRAGRAGLGAGGARLGGSGARARRSAGDSRVGGVERTRTPRRRGVARMPVESGPKLLHPVEIFVNAKIRKQSKKVQQQQGEEMDDQKDLEELIDRKLLTAKYKEKYTALSDKKKLKWIKKAEAQMDDYRKVFLHLFLWESWHALLQ